MVAKRVKRGRGSFVCSVPRATRASEPNLAVERFLLATHKRPPSPFQRKDKARPIESTGRAKDGSQSRKRLLQQRGEEPPARATPQEYMSGGSSMAALRSRVGDPRGGLFPPPHLSLSKTGRGRQSFCGCPRKSSHKKPSRASRRNGWRRPSGGPRPPAARRGATIARGAGGCYDSTQALGPSSDAPGTTSAGRSAAWLARLLWEQEAASSNLAAPTVFRNEPFGEYVEGFSHCGDGSCGSRIVFK